MPEGQSQLSPGQSVDLAGLFVLAAQRVISRQPGRVAEGSSMRRSYFVSVIAITMIVPSTLSARSGEIPTLDIRPVCRGIASQSADPGIGQGGQAETFRRCIESEQAVREQLKREWRAFSAADKRHCVTLAKTGGESSNTELLTCLEMARDVRVLRSAATAASGGDLTKPASPLSMPAVQPDLTGTASQPIPAKEAPKTDGEAARKEFEPAKTGAQTTAASEAAAQRKLADAEAALQAAKEEAGRARAEAERAKADAQAARDSEAAAKRKLADAEAARAATEKACRPGLASRLREWLRRPGSKNH